MLFQIIVDVLVDDLAVDAVLLLQRAEREHRVAGQFPGRNLLLRLEHRGKLLALLLEPVVTLLGKRPGDMFHVVGVVNLIRADVALGRHPLINAKPDKRREHQRRAVEKKQLARFFLINRGRARFVPQAQQEPALGRRQQLGARKHPAEAEPQHPAVQNRRRPLDERQADRGAKPVEISVIAQQFVGLQQAGEVRVLNHIQPAGGRDRGADAKHHERPGQGGGPAGGRATSNQRRQHDPQPHDKRPDPLGEQKPEQVLPDRDLHCAAHQGGHALNCAGQRAEAERRGAVGEVDAVHQREHGQQRQGKRAELGQCRLQPPAGQTAHKRQQAAVPLLPNEQQRQHEHRGQQNQIGEGIRNRGVQTFLRVIVDGRFA